MPAKEIRIKLKSYDHRLLDESVRKLTEVSKASGAKVRGPIPLPVDREIFTVIRSPHVDKNSREQFERRTHKRLVVLTNTNTQTISSLQRLIMPVGVEIQVKI